jgi:hypothetical protein
MTKGTSWFATGLFGFGFMLGSISGLSTNAGTSQTLLSALFAFVGGVLLTYAGFRRKRKGDAEGGTDPDLGATGVGLTFFSIGVVLGICAGIIGRVTAYNYEAARIPRPQPAAGASASTTTPAPPLSLPSGASPQLYSEHTSLCAAVLRRDFAKDPRVAESEISAFYYLDCDAGALSP